MMNIDFNKISENGVVLSNQNKHEITLISNYIDLKPVRIFDWCGKLSVNWRTDKKSFLWKEDARDVVEVLPDGSQISYFIDSGL
tara:strand:- start:246 stop:497 length:252 start_codon:yes stop_codon:yes gene_type:complete